MSKFIDLDETSLDELDRKILIGLSQAGRVRWSALAGRFGVSAPAIADRIRRLEQSSVIEGYTVRLSAKKLGFDLTAFVSVTLEHPQYRSGFTRYVQANPQIQACHHVVGEGDYLLKICCRSTAELEHLLSNELKALPGIQQTRTTIALSVVKDTTDLPIA
jgi:Lrp/AsnC family transcriptional regulator, leucine-responsive regulatory protein